MNSVFSRGQGVASLHQNLCSISKQLAMSNLTTIAPGYYANESMMDFLITPLSSAISDHSLITGTPEAIRGWLMSLPQDSRASRFQSQGNNSEKTILGTNGRKLGIASASYDRDLRSWKTSQASCLNPTSDEYSGTWPKSGMMLDGKLYLLKKQAIATKEIDCGLWPTPTLCGNHNRKGLSKTSGDGLATAVKQYPTPANSMMTMQDMEQAKFAGNGNRSKYRDCFPTPTVNDSKNNGADSQRIRNTPGLNSIVGGLLNPDWVEWLMGWPIGWSDLNPLTELKWFDPSIDPHPDIPRTTDKTENRVNRLKAIGNGQVPTCAAKAWTILST